MKKDTALPGGQEKASTSIVAQATALIHPEAEIRRALRLLFEPGQVVELRSLNTRWKTVSGYFDDMDKLARAALSLDGKVPAVYITLNPVDLALLARAANRLEKYARETTQDHHILRRRWIGFDFDPVRPSGVSSTDAEHEAALERARQVRDWLRERGWPDPIFADSGNGAHLLYRIDLPNDPEALTLVNRCLEAVAFAWEDARITVDQKVGNASRIWKLWGTMACKGDNVPARPHRRSRVLEAPERLEVVPRELLEELAATCPDEGRDARPDPLGVIAVTPDPGRPRSEWRQEPFALERWIHEHNLPVVASGPWRNGGWRWVINPCPWNPEHTNRAAYIVRLPNGAIQAGCHHNGCRGKDWHALRDLVEPGWRERKAQATLREASGGEEEIEAIPWPDPPDEAAFHGLAGDIVRAIEPHSEADPVALLVQFLVAFGNAAGRNAYYQVEADRHFLNLFAVLVGTTSRGRKGTSWGHVWDLFRQADGELGWATGCVEHGLSSGEGLIWRVRDKIEGREPVREKGRVVDYQPVVIDEGIKDKRLLILEAEFASALRVLQREGNTLSPVIRCAWDHGYLTALTKNSRAKATDAHISIIGHITKPELLRHLDTTEMANGFGNRFLWACVRRSKCLPEGGKLHQKNLAPLVQRLRKALDFARQAGELTWDKEARAEWHRVYPDLSEGKPGLLGAMTARAEAQVVRLACIYACLDRSLVIRLSHLKAALAVWDYCERSARFIFGASLGDPVADEILRALKNAPNGLTRTDIRDLFGRNKAASDIGRALRALVENGLARCEREETDGRPAERWYALTTKTTETTKVPAARTSVVNVVNVVTRDTYDEPAPALDREEVVF